MSATKIIIEEAPPMLSAWINVVRATTGQNSVNAIGDKIVLSSMIPHKRDNQKVKVKIKVNLQVNVHTLQKEVRAERVKARAKRAIPEADHHNEHAMRSLRETVSLDQIVDLHIMLLAPFIPNHQDAGRVTNVHTHMLVRVVPTRHNPRNQLGELVRPLLRKRKRRDEPRA